MPSQLASSRLSSAISAFARVSIRIAALAALGCSFTPRGEGSAPRLEQTPNLSAAARYLAADLRSQLSPWQGERALTVDPFLDRSSGYQTGVSQQIETALVAELLGLEGGLSLVPFDEEGLDRASLILTGTVTALRAPGSFNASVTLTDRESGLVIAKSAARLREAGLDPSPSNFYKDSPSLARDRSVDAYVRTATMAPGQAADALYLAQLSTAALLAEALRAYDDGRWEEALTAYATALERPDGVQLRTLNGVYLGNVRLGRLEAAETAFGRIATYGLETNTLAVKLLFRPGTTEFWPGPELGRMYPMWLRQLALAMAASHRCVEIIGHTSRTGTEAFNDSLSLARAEVVRRMLEVEAKVLAGRLRTLGVGYRQNIVGNGADDASDAVDRRVEFRVVPCTDASSDSLTPRGNALSPASEATFTEFTIDRRTSLERENENEALSSTRLDSYPAADVRNRGIRTAASAGAERGRVLRGVRRLWRGHGDADRRTNRDLRAQHRSSRLGRA